MIGRTDNKVKFQLTEFFRTKDWLSLIHIFYLQWILQPSYETIAVCGILILAIVLFSVVVIYNIFQVGIANKIQEYGKIKMCIRDSAEAMEAQGITKADIEGLTFPTSFNHDLFNYEPFSSAEGYNLSLIHI